ncbi:MAG: argininosuccinate lyase [Prolixibacteraceae bacterium]|nr:argininosuccinate lyase [Prolixibacteraceae bacterium]
MTDNNKPRKIWEKGIPVDKFIEKFTIGKDAEMDMYLAPYDVLGSMAHAIMLNKINLISGDELHLLLERLKEIYHQITSGKFVIEDGVEDIHSQVELQLTRELGSIGKKIHSGRSRNDQVLLDIKMFIRNEIKEVTGLVVELYNVLIHKSEESKGILIPGYTHLQVAMPSSFGLWFGAYAESLVDDLIVLNASWKVANQNPLGSAAGYGSSFPLDRQLTTDLLGFDSMNVNVVYAQMGRGKAEKIVAFGLSSIAATLSKLAYDVCLFMSQNFNFLSLPDDLTTGSSIMPHKKNPDVFELLRSHCNKIQALPNEIALMTNNLPSGYFRDYQLVKEVFMPAFDEIKSCLEIAAYALNSIKLNKNVLDNKRYDYLFSVEEVNKLVYEGMPFRDAYEHVAKKIIDGNFLPNKKIRHTHTGSIGNLGTEIIEEKMKNVLGSFTFGKVNEALSDLLAHS